ncbi:TonB-dependent receptor plug domain-containing protein [uncultured Mesonia sp.]|uniref:TonB-dependent receptor plug domain-containing protein n=1 Tax=uncultured Mesonia sp. TaxID=399731 RepID=UPI00374EBAA7
MRQFLFLILLFLLGYAVQAQKRELLDSVVLKASNIRTQSVGQNIVEIKSSEIKKYRPQLTDVLNFETPIFFKENGLGMVSSPSFRGTTAQQTAVLWNGINVNSTFLGQVDFNTLSAHGYSDILVRSGGGSAQLGSGAIGGSILLQNQLDFEKGHQLSLNSSLGSFATFNQSLDYQWSNQKISAQVGGNYVQSENDYPFFNSNAKNENAAFDHLNLYLNASVKLNNFHKLTFYSTAFNGERHFPILESTQIRTKYQDENYKSQLAWEYVKGKWSAKARGAYLQEKYTYFQNIERPNLKDHGTAKSLVSILQTGFKPNKNLYTEVRLNLRKDWAEGTAISAASRQISKAHLFLKQHLTSNWIYQAQVSLQHTEDFNMPILYQIGTNLQLNKNHSLKASFSKNYRIPTFNDLFWPGAGNLDLKPETSRQFEASYSFKRKRWQFGLTGYNIKISDMIRWLPAEASIWKPLNTHKVRTRGIEGNAAYKTTFKKFEVQVKSIYAFTEATNLETRNTLIYVPKHKLTAKLDLIYKNWNFIAQTIYTGKVYTQTNNNEKTALKAYPIAQTSLSYTSSNTFNWELGARVRNLSNENYFVVNYKPMPGRNFELFFNLIL